MKLDDVSVFVVPKYFDLALHGLPNVVVLILRLFEPLDGHQHTCLSILGFKYFPVSPFSYKL